MTKNVSFAELYLDNALFADAANQTIGAPGITADVLINRRNVTKRLTPQGQQVLDGIVRRLQQVTGLDIKVEWDIHCGCSCSCSPGYRLKTQGLHNVYRIGREDYRFHIWMRPDGTLSVRAPKEWMWSFHDLRMYNAVKSLQYPLPVKIA